MAQPGEAEGVGISEQWKKKIIDSSRKHYEQLQGDNY